MKWLTLVIGLLMVGAPLLAQSDSVIIDTTIVTPSPIDFDKVLNIDSMARFFGAEPSMFLIFVSLIILGTEICRRNIKRKGELFLVDNRSFIAPFAVGVLLAFIVPTGFSTFASIRFGVQGAVAAMIIHYLTSFMHTDRSK